ncbi:MAG: PDZ domain-containing protein [Phycisphaerae bacterium]
MRKITMLSMLFAAAIAAGAAWADEKAKDCGSEARADNVFVSEGQVKVYVTATAEGDKDGKPQVRIKTLRVEPKDADANKGDDKPKPAPKVAIRHELKPARTAWLGIRVSPVPAAVASQLGLGNEGVMIQNLIKGSPADKAGLDRYDVVIAAGKDERLKSVESFIAMIKAHKPGDKLPLTILRKGSRKSVTVVLREGPPAGEVRYVHEDDADEFWQDEFKVHKGMLRKGPKGWIWQGPGGEKIELPGLLWKDPPKPWPDVQIRVGTKGGGKTSFKISRTVDGRTIEIESADDGGILVRKSDKGSDKKAVARKYKNADELREKDPEAYDLYRLDVSRGPRGDGPRIFQPKPLIRHGKDATDAMRDQLRELNAELESQLKQLSDKARAEADAARSKIARAIQPEPRHQFEMDENGRITVEVREGDSAAKLTFKDEAEMKKKAPKLHRAYEKLLGGDG